MLAVASLVSVAALAASRHRDDGRLLDAEADRVLADPSLVRIAARKAEKPIATHCASCHGIGLTGDPAQGAPDLTDGDWLYGEGRVAEIEQTILYGIRSGHPKGRDQADMPAYATARPYRRYAVPPLSPGGIRDVVAFLGSRRGRPEDSAAVARGRAIYAGSGGCFDCHGEDGGGDPAIGAPNLRDAVQLYGDGSDAALIRSIAHGRAGVCPGWIGRLDPTTVRAIAVTVAARAREAANG